MISKEQAEAKRRSAMDAALEAPSVPLGVGSPAHPQTRVSTAPECFDWSSCVIDFPPEPFEPPEKRVLDLPHLALEVQVVTLQSGVTAASLDLRPTNHAPIQLRLPSDFCLFGFVQHGAFSIVLPDLGRRTFRASHWFIMRTGDLEFLVAEPISLLLFGVDKPVLNKLLQLAGPAECKTLRCFACPQLRTPSVVGATSNERLQWTAQRIQISTGESLHDRLELEARCLEWLQELFRLPELTEQQLCGSACSEQEAKSLREVETYLEAHLDGNHTLDDLSRRFNLNEFKLKRGFKIIFGVTVFRYLRKLRVQRAEQLLKESNLSVLEIAHEVGYSNPSHFARNFREQVGVLPKTYQRIQRFAT